MIRYKQSMMGFTKKNSCIPSKDFKRVVRDRHKIEQEAVRDFTNTRASGTQQAQLNVADQISKFSKLRTKPRKSVRKREREREIDF